VDATTNVYNEWAYKFVSGTASFDEWDTYVAAWTAAGGDSLTEYAGQELK
jgi:putative aldouronate transport system substrate-binding protein